MGAQLLQRRLGWISCRAWVWQQSLGFSFNTSVSLIDNSSITNLSEASSPALSPRGFLRVVIFYFLRTVMTCYIISLLSCLLVALAISMIVMYSCSRRTFADRHFSSVQRAVVDRSVFVRALPGRHCVFHSYLVAEAIP